MPPSTPGELNRSGQRNTTLAPGILLAPARDLFSAEEITTSIAAQPELRDRVALKLLLMMELRKGELASAQSRDFDLGRRRLRVHGKGGKIRQTPLPTEDLRQEIATLARPTTAVSGR